MLGLALNSASVFLFKSPSVNYVYHKMLLNENECYLVIVAKQILLVTINSVYGYKTRNNISGGGGGGGGGWSGGAMVMGELPVPGRPTIWNIVGQGSIALA